MVFKKDLIKIIIKSWFLSGYVSTVNKPANKAQGYKIGTKSFLSTFRRWLPKQINKQEEKHKRTTYLPVYPLALE